MFFIKTPGLLTQLYVENTCYVTIILRPFLIHDFNHRIFNKSNTRDITSGAGTDYSSGAYEFSPPMCK